MLTTKEAAAVIGVSEVALWKRRQNGQPPKAYPSASGKRFWYDESECRRFARKRDRLLTLEKRIEALEQKLAGE